VCVAVYLQPAAAAAAATAAAAAAAGVTAGVTAAAAGVTAGVTAAAAASICTVNSMLLGSRDIRCCVDCCHQCPRILLQLGLARAVRLYDCSPQECGWHCCAESTCQLFELFQTLRELLPAITATHRSGQQPLRQTPVSTVGGLEPWLLVTRSSSCSQDRVNCFTQCSRHLNTFVMFFNV
jgi:hypothetical protein